MAFLIFSTVPKWAGKPPHIQCAYRLKKVAMWEWVRAYRVASPARKHFPGAIQPLRGTPEERWQPWQVRGGVFVLTMVCLDLDELDEQKEKAQHGLTSWIPAVIMAVGLARRQLEARGAPWQRQMTVQAMGDGEDRFAVECGRVWPLNICSRRLRLSLKLPWS